MLFRATALLASSVAAMIGSTSAALFPDCSPKVDGHYPFNGTAGVFGPVTRVDASWEGRPLVALLPSQNSLATGPQQFPLVVFMHGSTGQIEMYQENLHTWASHGFVVVFPYIKSPSGDKNPLTTK